MKSAYEMFPLGLRFSHLALLRNLDRFAALSRGKRGRLSLTNGGAKASPLRAKRVAEYVGWYADFLDLHHRGEDDCLFPALRKHSAGRTTDVAHLDAWRHEHEAIYRLGEELRRESAKLAAGEPRALERLQQRAAELKELLTPHLRQEEEVLTPQHLQEMIPERELAQAQLAIPRSQGVKAVSMANFFVHSLKPGEQRALLGDTPWFFRKIVLGTLGARRARRFGNLMPQREVHL